MAERALKGKFLNLNPPTSHIKRYITFTFFNSKRSIKYISLIGYFQIVNVKIEF